MRFFAQNVDAGARSRGITVLTEEATTHDDLAPAFNRLAKQEVQAVIVPPNGLFRTNREQIVQLALAAHLPTIFAERENVEAGGFTSRAANLRQSPRRNIAPTPTPREQPSDLGALGSELDTLFPGN